MTKVAGRDREQSSGVFFEVRRSCPQERMVLRQAAYNNNFNSSVFIILRIFAN